MSEEIKATPNSFVTSELTPILLQETPNVRIYFKGVQVDNNADIKKNIKGSLIIKKKTKSKTFEESKFTRKDILPYDMVEIALDTDATASLCNGLGAYFKAFGGKQTDPYQEVSYVKLNDDIKFLQRLLKKDKELPSILERVDTQTLNSALNIKNLQLTKNEIEANIDNSNESYWQGFFSRNAWALSQLFNSPLMIYNGARYVGGKTIDNKSGKYTDFIYQNPLTQNISLIEIKTPTEEIFLSSAYRQDVPKMSEAIIGGVNQLLLQRQSLYNEYISLRNNTLDHQMEDFKAINIQSVLLIGKINGLSPMELKCFEAYRNELKSIEIITFDELLLKVENLIHLLKA